MRGLAKRSYDGGEWWIGSFFRKELWKREADGSDVVVLAEARGKSVDGDGALEGEGG